MDLESLKQITEIINTIGATSKEAFLWWLIISNASTYIFGLIWSSIGFYTIAKLIYFIPKISKSVNNLERLSKSAGEGCYFTEKELQKACSVLEKHYNKTDS
jgi:hypothetical protein